MVFNKMIAKATICAMVLSLLFSGCGNNVKTGSQSESEKVEIIRVWTGESHSKDVLTKLVEQYNETIGKQEGIKIEYTVHSGDYKNVLDMAIASSQQPEIFRPSGGGYAESGKITAISDMPGGEEFIAKYKDKLVKNVNIINGKVYSIPWSVTTIGLLYNKDMFKKAGIVDEKGEAKPPKTWEEMREYAKKLTNPKEEKYGIAIPLKWGGYSDFELINPYVSSIGRGIFDTTTGKFDFSVYKPLFTWLEQIREDNSYFPGPEGLDNDPARAQFAEGRIGMKFGASWDVGVLNDQFPAKIDWGVAEIPTMDSNVRYKSFMSPQSLGAISSDIHGKDPKKVFEVYKWLHSDEVLLKLYEAGKYIPVDANIVKNSSNTPTSKGWKEFALLAEKSSSIIYAPEISNKGLMFGAATSKIWTKTMSIDDAIEAMNKGYNEALEKGRQNGSFDINNYINKDYNTMIK